jgi:hypothetical protein
MSDAVRDAESIIARHQRSRQIARFHAGYAAILDDLRRQLEASGRAVADWPNLEYHARLGLLRDLYPDLSVETIQRLHYYVIYRLRSEGML